MDASIASILLLDGLTNGAVYALLGLATAGLASGLRGVTYRYAVRPDAANLQLKVGACACC